MDSIHRLVHRPHSMWLRRALFQIHLWVGVIVALYVVVIGVTGSVLVFVIELERFAYRGMTRPPIAEGQEVADPITVLDGVQHAYRDERVQAVYLPRSADENFFTVVERSDERHRYVYSDVLTGRVIGQTDLQNSWVGWLADLHINLLAGRTGLVINGVGAICLALMGASGVAIWWRGVRTWRRGMTVDFRKRWRRINFDLHNALGFWALGFVLMWAVTGAYYAWPAQVMAFVQRISPVNAALGEVSVPERGGRLMVDLRGLIAQAQASMPTARLAGIVLPTEDRGPLMLYMARGDLGDFTQMNYVYFDPWTGSRISMWERGKNHSVGDWVIFLMGPLHFGMYWGMLVKIIWAAAGLCLPILAVTGIIMYWNRYLSKKLAALRALSVGSSNRAPVRSAIPPLGD